MLERSCYHDHNRGNVNMMEVRDHWYWARTDLSPYAFAVADTMADERCG